MYNPYIPGGRSYKDYATCKDCTAAQVDTIHCSICNIDKPIDSFLKAQRSEAKPRCKACVQFCLDTERYGKAPNIDNYCEGSSDESSVDDEPGDYSEDYADTEATGDYVATEDHAIDEDSDEDVDGPKAGAGTNTSSVSKQMASINLQDTSFGSRGSTTPITKTRGTTPASRATPALAVNNSDNDVNGSSDGAWETVKVAGRHSAYRTPTTWASLAASGMATPAVASTAGYTTVRTTTTARTSVNSGFASPTTLSPAVSYSSTGRKKWGKPAKLKPGEVVEDVWMSKTAEKNGWEAFGGQPKLVKPKTKAHNADSDDEDDGEE